MKIVKTWEDYDKWKLTSEEADALEESEEKYGNICSEIIKNNKLLLTAFEDYLRNIANLSEKVIRRHKNNVSFYIDSFLLNYGIVTPVSSGISEVSEFLGYWFPKKGSDSPTVLKQNGASLKKFYIFLNEVGEISDQELTAIKTEIPIAIEGGIEYLDNFDEIYGIGLDD